MSVHSANLLLTGYTDVLALRFSYEHASGKCDVAVTLAADRQCTKRLELECRDVHARPDPASLSASQERC